MKEEFTISDGIFILFIVFLVCYFYFSYSFALSVFISIFPIIILAIAHFFILEDYKEDYKEEKSDNVQHIKDVQIIASHKNLLEIDKIISEINNKFGISIKSDRSICDSFIDFEINKGNIKEECRRIKFDVFSYKRIDDLSKTIDKIFVGIYAFYDEDFFEHKKNAINICGGSIGMVSDIECYIDFCIKRLVYIASGKKFELQIKDRTSSGNNMLLSYYSKLEYDYHYPLIERIENIFTASFMELRRRIDYNINNMGNYAIGNFYELKDTLENLERDNNLLEDINAKLLVDIEKIESIMSQMNIFEDDFMEKTIYLKDILNKRISEFS